MEYNGTKYRYVHNLQGDIVAIVDGTGTRVVEYKYDAWGRKVSMTGCMAVGLGEVNPYRYRGYVWDKEFSASYVCSRYYDGSFARFINSDNLIGSVSTDISRHNLYCYCGNNPVNRIDSNGHLWASIKKSLSDFKNAVQGYIGSKKEEIKGIIKTAALFHYGRNGNNSTESIATIKQTYKKVPEWQDKYHENTNGKQGEEAKYNDKHLSPNGGHFEVIICSPPGKEAYIVDENVDESNMGTPNYASNEDFILKYYLDHFMHDMMPYYMFGNTREENKGWLKGMLD